MDVAFFIPPSPDHRKIIRLIDCSQEAKGDYLWQPNDFMIISSHLAPGDGMILVDGTAEDLTGESFLGKVALLDADILFFALSSVCWQSDLRFFHSVKEIHPDLPFYVIGDIFLEEEYAEYILGHCLGVVVNPYGVDLGKMTDNARDPATPLPGVRTRSGFEPVPDRPVFLVEKSGIPRHKPFLSRKYLFPFARHAIHATVTTMWGCPFTCTYCPDARFSPMVRPHGDVVRELETLRDLEVRELFFADKSFGFPTWNIMALLSAMKESFDFSWTCYFHPGMYRADLLEAMCQAGCHTIIIGIDSADLPGLHRYDRRVAAEKISGLLAHAGRLGLAVCADFILGLPHEDEEDIRKTIDYAMTLPIDFASFNIAAPFPGTEIRKKVRESGKLTFGREGHDSVAHGEDLGICKVSAERIRQLRNEAVKRFYLRPQYLLRRIGKTVSFAHFLIQSRQMLALVRRGQGPHPGKR